MQSVTITGDVNATYDAKDVGFWVNVYDEIPLDKGGFVIMVKYLTHTAELTFYSNTNIISWRRTRQERL